METILNLVYPDPYTGGFVIFGACVALYFFFRNVLPRFGPAKERALKPFLSFLPVRFLASYGLAGALLFCLLLLTWLGTLAQVDDGLWLAQKKYFESLAIWREVGGFTVPVFPGGVTCMVLLGINLMLGGLLRIRWTARTAGVLVAHVGIGMLLLAGLVKHKWSDEGALKLYPGQRSDEYQSYQRWEVAFWRAMETVDCDEFLIRDDEFRDLGGGRERRFTSGELPFDVRLGSYVENARALPRSFVSSWRPEEFPSIDREPSSPTIDGYALYELEREKEAEFNVAGLWVEVEDADSGTRSQALLSGFENYPFTFQAGGQTWAVHLRKQLRSMPFTIELADFRKVDHARMTMAASFESDVEKFDEPNTRDLASKDGKDIRIQMNEPLRDSGLVLFQASWGPSDAGPDEELFSVFAVVRNPSDKLPEVACWVIGIGLLFAFLERLYSYVRGQAKLREKREQLAASGAPVALSPEGRKARVAVAWIVLALFTGGTAYMGLATRSSESAGEMPAEVDARRAPWSEDALELASILPVQDGGRVKPFSTLAGFKLLKLNGKRSLEIPGGEELDPTAWALDVMLYPEAAEHYRCFQVQNTEVLREIGLEFRDRKRRTRLSYEDLRPALTELRFKASEYAPIEPKERTPEQHHLVNLASNVHEFEMLRDYLNFARRTHPTDATPSLVAIFGEEARPGFTHVIAEKDALGEIYVAHPEGSAEQDALGMLFASLEREVPRGAFGMAFVPPTESVEERGAWFSPGEIVHAWFDAQENLEQPIGVVGALEELVASRDDDAAFLGALGRLHERSSQLAAGRGEYEQIEREVSFYQRDYFTNALVFFLLGFVLVAVSWMLPNTRWLQWGIWACATVGAALVLWGVTQRCIIRDRPPISTLYETILFITGSIVLVCLVVEWMNKKRIALATSTALGAFGMFLAMKYEFREAVSAGDTMPSLVAVLDTNFWLATHVTTVTLGYAAGLLAAALAHVWLAMRLFRLDGGDAGLRKSVANMVYGVLCFGLLFSVVGTILGGVWANYSWGRFWGWDPKENGALMICLAELVIVHLRMGGYLRDFGVAVASVVNGMVIAFSWWHVNFLGVGLHSYGFTEGIVSNLNQFYVAESLVVVGATVWSLGARSAASTASPTGDDLAVS